MKKFNLFTIAIASALIVCGCASSKTEKSPETAIMLGEFNDPDTAMAVASNFASGFEKALLTSEFTALAAVLPANSKAKLTAENFLKMRSGLITLYGQPQKLEYLTFLDQSKIRDYLWRVKFSKPSKDGKTFSSREIIFCVRVYCEIGKKPDIAGFFFQRF